MTPQIRKINYEPHLPQHYFHEACKRHYRTIFGIAGIRSGKSIGGCNELIKQALSRAGTRWAFVAPTYGDAKAILDVTLLEYLPSGLIKNINRNDHEIELTNGSVILWRSADRPERLRALGDLNGAWLDEAEQYRPHVYKIMRGRVSRLQGKLWVTTSPQKWVGTETNKKPSWIFQELANAGITISPTQMVYTDDVLDEYGKIAKAGRIAVIKWSVADNPYFPEDELEILREEYGPLWAAQELDGLYVDLYAGGIFKEEYFIEVGLPQWYDYKIIAFDPAISRTGLADYSVAQVWGARDGNAYCMEEIRGHFSYVEQRNLLKTMVDKYQVHKVISEDVAYQRSIIEDLAEDGIPIEGVTPDGNKVARASRLSGPMASRKVFFGPGIITPDFLNEFAQFPNWPNDDRVDTAGYAVYEVLHGCKGGEAVTVGERTMSRIRI